MLLGPYLRRWGPRGGSVRVGGPPLSLFEQVLLFSAGRPVFTAGNPANILNAGNLVSITDHNDPAHFLTQSAGSLQVPAPAPHAAFKGAKVAAFTGAQVYQSTRPPADWAFAHDGSSEAVFIFRPNLGVSEGAVASTSQNGASAPGLQAYWYTSQLTLGAPVGAGGISVVPPAVVGPIASVATYMSLRMSAGASPQWEARQRSTVVVSGAFDNPPVVGPPGQALTVGALSPALVYPMWGEIAAVLFFPPLSSSQRLIVEKWIYEEYGIVAPSLESWLREKVLALAPFSWVEADNYQQDSISGRVRALVEQVPAGTGIRAIDPAHSFLQTVSSRQPVLPVPVAAWGGALGLVLTGTRGLASTAPKAVWKFGHDGSGWTSVCLAIPTSPAVIVAFSNVTLPLIGLHQYLNSNQSYSIAYPILNVTLGPPPPLNTSRKLILRHGVGSAPHWLVQDVGHFDLTGNYGAAPSASDPERPMFLASQDTGGGVPNYGWIGPYAGAIFFNRVLSDAELKIVSDYFDAKYSP